MVINEQDKSKIVTTLNQETGWEWASDTDGVYCKVKLPIIERREEAEHLFNETLQSKGLPSVATESSLRGVEEAGKAFVSARYTSNEALLTLLQQSDPLANIAEKRSQIQTNHAQIAAMLVEKTSFPWISDIEGVHCKVKLPIIERREEAERLFNETLQNKGLPYVATDSSLRGIGEAGKAIVSASYTSASVLQKMLCDVVQLHPSANEGYQTIAAASNPAETSSSSQKLLIIEKQKGAVSLDASVAALSAGYFGRSVAASSRAPNHAQNPESEAPKQR